MTIVERQKNDELIGLRKKATINEERNLNYACYPVSDKFACGYMDNNDPTYLGVGCEIIYKNTDSKDPMTATVS